MFKIEKVDPNTKVLNLLPADAKVDSGAAVWTLKADSTGTAGDGVTEEGTFRIHRAGTGDVIETHCAHNVTDANGEEIKLADVKLELKSDVTFTLVADAAEVTLPLNTADASVTDIVCIDPVTKAAAGTADASTGKISGLTAGKSYEVTYKGVAVGSGVAVDNDLADTDKLNLKQGRYHIHALCRFRDDSTSPRMQNITSLTITPEGRCCNGCGGSAVKLV